MSQFNPQFPNPLGIQTVTPPHNQSQAAMQYANAQRLAQQQATGVDAPILDEDSGEEPNPIFIKIVTPLIISGDNNLIALEPSIQSAKVAMAVVNALKQMSAGSHGIPMIDENGRPRPVTVEVEAEIRIEGSKNIVGEKAVISTLTGATKLGGTGTKDTRKREREDSEPAGVVAKRIKNEE